MSISVVNERAGKIEVCISQWGDDGGTGWFKLPNKHNETWERTDRRGFVMRVRDDSGAGTAYYVTCDSAIHVHDDCVLDGTTAISPISRS